MRLSAAFVATILVGSCCAQQGETFPDIPDNHKHYEFFHQCLHVGFKVKTEWLDEQSRYPIRTGDYSIRRVEFAQAAIDVIDTFNEVMAKQTHGSGSLTFFTNTWKKGLLAWIKQFTPELESMGKSPRKLRATVHSFTPKVKDLVTRLRKLDKR